MNPSEHSELVFWHYYANVDEPLGLEKQTAY